MPWLSLPMKYPVPPLFLERMQSLLGQEYPAFLAELERPPWNGLRLNPLKITLEQFRALNPFPGLDFASNPWFSAGLVFREGEQAAVGEGLSPGKHPYHAAGVYYLQEPSAAAVVEALDPQPGERILDLSAAPGGKSTQVAGKLAGQGLLVSNEIHPRRAWDLAENLERWGARNAIVTNETPERLAERWAGFFDRVLVDAPCSGEGMFRKSEAARGDWSPELVSGCAVRQGTILEVASRLVAPGGVLVYSTCTFAPEENEGVIGKFLQRSPEFSLAAHRLGEAVRPGKPGWAAGQPGLEKTARIFPHLFPGEGHFVAVMHRAGGERTVEAPASPGYRLLREKDEPYQLLQAWWKEHLACELPARIAQAGSYLYAIPEGMPPLAGLKVLHPGWWLAEARGKHLVPAHALALALHKDEFARGISLAPADPRLRAYLRGEAFPAEGPDGWVGVCVDQFPLGWGKRLRGVVKNHYPKGLRKPG